ncbi:transcriptional regulator with XRE-family HTH domain [Desulfofundulus luciae]|jgi:transcriptional regulator with XRE-family HTH domain|uniref:Transcriptional regulator with XRE-family HTH domain n=2 Tax=Desulfofundulus luciae TaxID=74702 RepID=A0ABU0B4Z2_9FIRM|nr:transcriptional regulator with XRE-family HTH domain [Desulfofundulus luciae]
MNALAKLSGASQSAISEIESGKRKPTFDVLERIVKGLGLTLAEFFSEETPSLSPDLRQLLDEAESLTPEQRQKLVEFIRSMKGVQL